jgi:16S rRNA G966 N2-methylase RsmD
VARQIKQISRKDKQNLIKSTLKNNQGLSNKKIARLLGVSPTSVAKYRLELFGVSNLDPMPEDTNTEDWTQHIWVKRHPEILKKSLSSRTLKCLRTPGVLDKLVELEGTTVSPRLALTLLRKEQREQSKNPVITVTEDDVLLFRADLRNESDYDRIKPSSIDLILVDMMYKAEYAELYPHLACISAKLLKPNGSLVVMTGQLMLPQAMQALGEHLTYNWCHAYMTPNGSQLVHPRRVIPKWKAILHYVKGSPNNQLPYIPDTHIPPSRDADDSGLHPYQQSLPAFVELVKAFSVEGDTIMDVCMGSATTVIAALTTGGRKVIGSDVDPQAVATAKRRVKEFWLANK